MISDYGRQRRHYLPLSWESEKRLLLEDVILALKLPCVIVADAGLGTINASVLTARYLKERGIRAKGFFFNHWDETDPMQQDNWAMTETLTGLPILAGIKDGDRDLSLSCRPPCRPIRIRKELFHE